MFDVMRLAGEGGGPMAQFFALLQRYWRRLQIRHVLVVTILLVVIGEQYPFSNFPMYSKVDDESDVLFITDQNDKPLPMHTLFGTSTSTQKKVYMAELKKICNPKKRDTADAKPEEQREAGGKLMEKLFPRLKRDRLASVGEGITTMRVYYKIFTLDGGDIAASKPVLVAERPL